MHNRIRNGGKGGEKVKFRLRPQRQGDGLKTGGKGQPSRPLCGKKKKSKNVFVMDK